MIPLRVVLTGLLAVALLDGHQAAQQYALWQADLQVRSLTVTEVGGNLHARIVIAAEFGEALAARADVLLPVGVGLVSMGRGCRAGPSPDGIRELRARVECRLGNLKSPAIQELTVVTTLPPKGVVRGFAVVAMSDTPDPRPGNNFAERVIPLP